MKPSISKLSKHKYFPLAIWMSVMALFLVIINFFPYNFLMNIALIVCFVGFLFALGVGSSLILPEESIGSLIFDYIVLALPLAMVVIGFGLAFH